MLAGLGMGIVASQGVAAATPSDSAAASQTKDSGQAADSDTSDAGPSAHDTADDTAADTADTADDKASADEASDEISDRGGRTATKARSRAAAADVPADSENDADVAAETMHADPPVSAPATLRSLVSTRPVTAENIVGDVLTWVGLPPLADQTPAPAPAPATPVSALVESLWLAVRQGQYTWNNQRPTADVTISGPGPGAAVTGTINAVDYDDSALTYTLASGPAYGRVSIDALGAFSYAPGAAAAGRADRFTIRVDDTPGNPFHVHGLLGLLGLSRPTEVTVMIAGSSVRETVSPSVDIDELVSRGVAVTTDRRGAVSVIEGRFTDQIVVNAADAAVVLNGLAPALGASADFADASGITIAEAGAGGDVERFYRFTETVKGVRVLGSDVILVTDAAGQVTSVFNYYRGLGEGFDVTPDASVDDDTEVRLIASAAYLGSRDDKDLETFTGRSAFASELVVYTRAEDGPSSLAWRAVVRLPGTGEMSAPGATYLIRADGDAAGEIIVTLSDVQPVSTSAVATDWLGASRAITVDTRTVLWYRSSSLFDAARNITTHKTSYGLWGLGRPSLPGAVVKRSLFGWDKAAISAHANTALVYDYYEDVLGRTSFDDAGAAVVVSIKYNPKTGLGYANAFWDPLLQQFAFGDSGYLQAAVDIVAHEYTHAVVTSIVGNGTSVLDYGESGALNEAYADIFGVLVEGKTDAGRWLIGEDSDLGAIRNLADPGAVNTSLGRYRDSYSTRYTGSADDGGEHLNSTIFGHAAYLMMTDAATTAVSDPTWARVFHHSLGRLGSGATFVDGRSAVLSAAGAQGLTVAQRAAISRAFDAVEIYGVAASSAV